MVAVTSAVLGAAALGFGAYNAVQGRQQQQQGLETQRQGALQAQEGYRLQEQGAQLQYQLNLDQSQTSRQFAQQNFDLNKQAADYSKQIAAQSSLINQGIINTQFSMEAQRQKAMELDAKRQQLEVIRNQQRARALALSTASRQGAQFGSGLQGGYGQASGQSNVNALGIQQNLQIGRDMFGLNAQLAGQRKQQVDLETQYAFARADQQTAQAGMQYNYALANAGFQDRSANIQTNYMSAGQGIINRAQGLTSMGQGQYQGGASQSQFGGQLMQLGMNLPGYGQTISNNLQSLQSMYTPVATMSGFQMPQQAGQPLSLDPGRYNTGRYSNYGYGG